ncbi:hypothetical protein H0H81_000889, partial [Sphagnurus paluster]
AAIRPDATPNLRPQEPKASFLPDTLAEKLIAELHEIMTERPTEQSPGSEDIYKLNTGIAWESGDFHGRMVVLKEVPMA